MKVNEKEYIVDFDFRENHKGELVPWRIKTGFKTESEAQVWADENTTDGKVNYQVRIW